MQQRDSADEEDAEDEDDDDDTKSGRRSSLGNKCSVSEDDLKRSQEFLPL